MIVDTPNDIANRFNEYFINIGSQLAESLTTNVHFDHYLQNTYNHVAIKFHMIDEEKILSIIKKLKHKFSSGSDSISNHLLKYAATTISKPLMVIINQMLTNGIFPEKLKLAKVIPVFKSGDDQLFSNYRPISLLSSISKIFEYVIQEQLVDYLLVNNLLCNEQFGFRSGYSTELAALHLVDNMINEIDNGKTPINIYIDLSKAFDTLNHDILIHKLNYYGVKGSELKLFDNYLSNRKQYTEVNGYKSNTQMIQTGVPQGSILGPLLFLLYINDLPRSSNNFKMIMYADDTTLYCNIENREHCEDTINKELSNIHQWLTSNKLSLNIKKTKFMVFHTTKKKIEYPDLNINGIAIEKINQFSFLGLYINNNLTWDTHIKHISLKISKIIFTINRLKHIYPQHILHNIYNTLILPHLNYCVIIWGLNCTPLYLLQKKAMRTITCS